ncbi:unnamed protein product [Macrosiphum euphorbiae]|uniref:CCHC-type domain-containing protein n=1 Tax=Macrosiphum euphorbiae TaxID=13131 RepID=A0AAV0Y8L0_9HEMI|nr:unnamed protein product [Macrosiphum euphorbiae]
MANGGSVGVPSPARMTRTEAEAKYAKLLDSLMDVMGTLEAAVQAAPNTKLDIKTAVRTMGANLRDFKGLAKMLGMVRNPDAVEQRIKSLQQQQLQQHSQSFKLMSEIRAEQLRCLEQGNGVHATSPSQNLPQELDALNLQLLEQGKKMDLGYNQTLQLKEQINNLLQERRQDSKLPQQQRNRRQKKKQVAADPASQTADSEKLATQIMPVDQSETPEQSQNSEWTEARKKKSKPALVNLEPNRPPRKPWDAAALVRKRTPKTEAVTISAPREGETYASVMKRVTQEVNLRELGVEVITTRKTKSGAVLLEVGNSEEAGKLADRMRQVIGEDATVGRPTRSTPILILDVPNWIEEAEVISQLVNFDSSFGDCQIRISDNQGSRTAFCRIPMKVASKVADAGRIRIGWAMCRAKLLERKDRVCYKCQGTGHVAAACNSEAKPKACFKCKSLEHLARECVAPPREKTKLTRSRTPSQQCEEPERNPPPND